jgi:hypothetical protein
MNLAEIRWQRAEIAQSVLKLALGWVAKELGLDVWQEQQMISFPQWTGYLQGLPILLSNRCLGQFPSEA